MRYLLHLPVLLETSGWILYVSDTAMRGGECGVALFALIPMCVGVFVSLYVPKVFLINMDKVETILKREAPTDVEMVPISTVYTNEAKFALDSDDEGDPPLSVYSESESDLIPLQMRLNVQSADDSFGDDYDTSVFSEFVESQSNDREIQQLSKQERENKEK